MPNNGVMKEISSLLAQDMSCTEVIALGFKRSTVYRTLRLMRQDQKLEAEKVQLSESQGQMSESQGQKLESQGQMSESQGQMSESQGQMSESQGQKLESLSNHLTQELSKLVDPVKVEKKSSTTPNPIKYEEIPTEQPSSELPSYHPTPGMFANGLGEEREENENEGVRILTPRNAAIGAFSFVLVLLGILLAVPTLNYDLAVLAYSLLYANTPYGAASFFGWWEQWRIPMAGFLAVSGVAPVFILAFLSYKKGQRD